MTGEAYVRTPDWRGRNYQAKYCIILNNCLQIGTRYIRNYIPITYT